MKKKVERWLAKKLGMKPEDVSIKSITISYEYLNNATFEMTEGKKTIDIKNLQT